MCVSCEQKEELNERERAREREREGKREREREICSEVLISLFKENTERICIKKEKE